MSTREVILRGTFNLENIMASIIVGKLFHIPNRAIAETIRNFKPLPHRLEFVTTFEGISYYNDSLATVPEATMAAIDALGDKDIVLLAGGYDRGLSYDKLAKKIVVSRIRGLVLFAPSGHRLWNAILQFSGGSNVLPDHAFVSTMQEAVETAHALASSTEASVVLLSPASASFGTFRDYADRGEQFRIDVQDLEFRRHVASTDSGDCDQ